MSARTVRRTRRALRRLDEIGAHISLDDPGAAGRVVARIASSVLALTEQPALRRVGRLNGTRELVLVDIPYIIAYRVTLHDVEVLTILHTTQQWPRSL